MSPSPLILKRSWLLSVFLIIPAALLVVYVDQTYLESSLLPYMGLGSLFIPLYLLFFELPHILASFLGFFDREYAEHYRRHIIIALPVILTCTLILAWWQYYAVVLLYLVLTMYHVMKQQTGVSLILGAPKSTLFHVWSVLGVIGAAMLYVALFAPFLIPSTSAGIVAYGVPVLLGCFVIVGMLFAYEARETGAWMYILGTVAMIASSFYLLTLAYVFLAIFVMRFAHDVIAFMFYLTHEYNRNHTVVKNMFYGFLPRRPVSILIAVPLFGILIGLALRASLPSVEALFTLTVLLGFAHYYFESFMWKRGSLHRAYVRVS